MICALAFSPDGRRIATGGGLDRRKDGFGEVKVFDARSHRGAGRPRGHTASVRSLAFSPDGTTLATGGVDATVRLWDVEAGKARLVLGGFPDCVRALGVSPDGRTLAVAGRGDGVVTLLDASTGAEIARLVGHGGPVLGLSFSPDGRTLATGGLDADDQAVGRARDPGRAGPALRNSLARSRFDASIIGSGPGSASAVPGRSPAGPPRPGGRGGLARGPRSPGRPATPGPWRRRSTGSWPRSGPRRRSTPVGPADDAEFLRRVCLDLVGKIPTAAEARDFLDDPAPDKRRAAGRAAARQPGLPGPGHRALAPAPAARGRHRGPGPVRRAGLRGLAPQEGGRGGGLRPDRPRDPHGQARRPANASADQQPAPSPRPPAFYVAKEGKPENLAAGTSRVFLGVRLECAQCHNHPFAKWKREEFWGFAAFFAGVPKQGPDDGFGAIREVADRRELTIPGTDEDRQGRLPRRHRRSPGRPGPSPARSWPTGSPRPRTRTSPGPRSTASGPASSAPAWSTRSTTWAARTPRAPRAARRAGRASSPATATT